MDLLATLDDLTLEFQREVDKILSLKDLEELRITFLGRKGRLARIMGQLSCLEATERPKVGQKANLVKEACNRLLEERKCSLENRNEDLFLQHFDESLPGRQPWQGSLHPDTLVIEEVCDCFRKLGFSIAAGPEVETDHYNFELLNIPQEHPARDMQDSLYISDRILMRTHTSPVQARSMLAQKPPLAIVAPGKVYRRDSDLTHTPMFHQIEGLLVDYGVTMAHLRGVLTAFVQTLFGSNTAVRFRPSFFPFTEPSAEVDISCFLCGGSGSWQKQTCRVCKGTGWVEILGCGMVDPDVFVAVNYPEEVTGFAFGLGVERIAMLKYGIDDLRIFFENDLRFLRQFN